MFVRGCVCFLEKGDVEIRYTVTLSRSELLFSVADSSVLLD
jgi:hypothetical protein